MLTLQWEKKTLLWIKTRYKYGKNSLIFMQQTQKIWTPEKKPDNCVANKKSGHQKTALFLSGKLLRSGHQKTGKHLPQRTCKTGQQKPEYVSNKRSGTQPTMYGG